MPLHTHAHLWPIARKPLFPLSALATRRVTPSVFAASVLQQKATRTQARTQTDDTPAWRQRALKNVPPAPQRREKPLPLGLVAARAWIGEMWQEGAWEGREAKALAKILKGMTFDSVIYSGDFALTLVQVEAGYPHYRLMHGRYVLGGVDIPAVFDWESGKYAPCAELPRIQADLARYLVGCGFTAELASRSMTTGAAKIPFNASKRALYPLLKPVVTMDRAKALYAAFSAALAQLDTLGHDARALVYTALLSGLMTTEETPDHTLTERLIEARLCAIVIELALTTEALIPRQMSLI